MISRRRFWYVALGVAAGAFAALGYLGAGAWGLPSRTKNASEPALATVVAKDEGAGHGQKRSDCCGTGGCSCGTTQEFEAAPAGVDLVQADKSKMMKASPQAMAKGAAARQAIRDHQQALASDGVYRCCIKPGCTFCSTAADMCPCAMNLSKGGPVCPECWGGWTAGQGRLGNIDPAKVQVIPLSKLKMMYKMKAMNFDKAAAPANPR